MTEAQEQLDRLVKRIETHQKDMNLSDAQFVARFQRFIGTSKTWRNRLCARDWKELGARLDKWTAKLSAFVAELDGGSVLAEFFDKLPITAYAQDTYEILQGTKSDRRCAWLIGPTGIGKTECLRRIVQKNPGSAIFISANETWKDSRMQIALGLAKALGSAVGYSAAATFANAVEHLKFNPVTICFDEMHEGGVLLMKLIKSIINETRAKVIVGVYPTTWNRLINGNTDATAEAQQLLGRSYKPIEMRWTMGITIEDAVAYLHCATILNGRCKPLAEKLLPVLRQGGNLRLLADAVELARMNAEENGEDPDADMIEQAVAALVVQRKRDPSNK